MNMEAMENLFLRLIRISNEILALNLDTFEDLAQLEYLQNQQAGLIEQIEQVDHSSSAAKSYIRELKSLESQIQEKLYLNRNDSENQIKKMQNAVKLRGKYQSNPMVQAEGYFVDNQN
ncbi:hypothetical protein NLX71_23600 [Paenibacillus sp. MZ04-78.2]|uniref:hypothetical protein n=1 Tax=Paenibacillus sp. MZ04-78.2 TaxID=2962034 RepID=UPI0020B8D019|nr:hypothetical protein [Paenibacillus sp. MZ04-78.2]MCP3776246.1 hypothetical protein [Paenibacillus sp. MZ04-78.2]